MKRSFISLAALAFTTRLPSLVTDGNGGYHDIQYNAQGKPTLVKLNNSANTDHHITTTYMSNGIDVDTVTRKLLGVPITLVDYNYYSNRDIQSATDATGRTISYVWNAKGQPTQITDSATGDVIGFSYDTNSRPNNVTLNSTLVASTTYDVRGNLVQSLDSTGRLSQYAHDNLERLTREVGPDDAFTAYDWACCYIEAVRSGKMVNGLEKTQRKSVTLHDARALPYSTMDSDGRTTKFEYDIAGRFVKLTDPKNQTTEWIYDLANRLTSKKYPNNTSEGYTYGSFSRLATFTNRRSHVNYFYYEYDGLLDAIGKSNYEPEVTFNYDSWRRIDTISQNAGTYAMAGTYSFDHDLLGRPTMIDGPWTDDTISFNYNDVTRSVTRTSPGGFTQTTTSNAYGQVASIANVLGTFTNGYDSLGGLLTSITHTGANAGFNTAFTYHGDNFDRALASITSTKPGGATVGKHSYTYGPNGNIDTWKREAPLANPSGLTRQFESKVFYDLADQVSSVIHSPLAGSSVAESAHHYVYDLAGSIASKQIETPGSAATMTPYSHNVLNQITSLGGSAGDRAVTVRGTSSEAAKVKAKSGADAEWKNARMLEGNRFEADLDLANGANQIVLQARDGSNNVSSYAYSLNLASAPTAAPTHDADGNMTSDGSRTYTWDSQNRLVRIGWGSSLFTIFKYNALGQRSERITQSGGIPVLTEHYLYDGIQLVDYRSGPDANTAPIKRRYFPQGETRLTGSTWESFYYTRDHLGSIREVVKSDGVLQARYDYDPYGKRSAQYLSAGYSGGCDLGFTGHLTLPSQGGGQTELVLTHFRAYDPSLGRWLSADPIREEGGMNLYGYVGNNPLYYTDPEGLTPAGAILGGGIGAWIGGVVGGGVGGTVGVVGGGAGGTLACPGFGTVGGAVAGGATLGTEGAVVGAVAVGGIGAWIGDKISDWWNESSNHGKGERNWARDNPNPNKPKSRCPQTGKKLPPKPPEKPRPPDVPRIPRGKGT